MAASDALKREAREAATFRGHDLGLFDTPVVSAATLERGHEATCLR